MKKRLSCLSTLLTGFLCVALPGLSMANISNTATTSYRDVANNNLSGTSNTVIIVTPPVITSSTTVTANIGVAFNYTISGTNAPTSFNATGLPAGLSINTATGLISGTPNVAGVFPITLSATNAAGSGTATLTLTVNASANVTLTKTASSSTARVGDVVTFTIQYQNTASGTATQVVISDVIPTGSTLVTGSITNGGVVSGNTITWTIGTVAGSASGQVSFQVRVN